MADPFLAEIRMLGFNFPPTRWAYCNGAYLSIAQNTALYSLLGTSFGGDGRTNFGLPDFRGGRVPLGAGQGPGLSPRFVGESGGEAGVTLTNQELPVHGHQMMASTQNADVASPTAATALGRSVGQKVYGTQGSLAPLDPQAVGTAPGAGSPHNNLMPYQVLNYCIALAGIYPQRP